MTYPYDLGTYGRKISTTSPEAQTWFDRGLNWTFNFYHEEAIACFRKALEADPGCAMAHWGISYALGPNYNMPWQLYDAKGLANALGGAYDAMIAFRGDEYLWWQVAEYTYDTYLIRNRTKV